MHKDKICTGSLRWQLERSRHKSHSFYRAGIDFHVDKEPKTVGTATINKKEITRRGGEKKKKQLDREF